MVRRRFLCLLAGAKELDICLNKRIGTIYGREYVGPWLTARRHTTMSKMFHQELIVKRLHQFHTKATYIYKYVRDILTDTNDV